MQKYYELKIVIKAGESRKKLILKIYIYLQLVVV